MKTPTLLTPLPGNVGQPKLPLGGLGIPVIMFLVTVYFWQSALFFPIKMLTVLFHEMSHGFSAVLTGGSMHQINLSQDLGGACWTAGGIRWIVLSAGYLGSLLWGSGLLLVASHTRYDRQVVQVLGALLAAVTIVYVRPFVSFGFIFGLVMAGAFLLFAKHFGEIACDQMLRYIGLTSSFYVILDIKSDLIDRNIPCSDAYRMGEMLMLPGWVVGIGWMLLALFLTWQVLRSALGTVPKQP